MADVSVSVRELDHFVYVSLVIHIDFCRVFYEDACLLPFPNFQIHFAQLQQVADPFVVNFYDRDLKINEYQRTSYF